MKTKINVLQLKKLNVVELNEKLSHKIIGGNTTTISIHESKNTSTGICNGVRPPAITTTGTDNTSV
ncbi:hypothetical protein [Pontimicrobium sp. MEBiC01747]